MTEKFFERAANFFREDLNEVVGAYFDGQKIFIVNDGSDIEHLVEKNSIACGRKVRNFDGEIF